MPRKGKAGYLKSLDELQEDSEIELAVRKAFQESQRTVSIQKSQIAILRRVYERCNELGKEAVFNNIICRMVNKILPTKKNEPAADRIVKLVSSFATAINPSLKKDGSVEDTVNVDEAEEDAFSGFIEHLTVHLLRGLDAANKNVRYRVCHLLSYLMHNMSVIDRELFDTLNQELLNRVYDKEPSVRIKAITTLASFQEPDGTATISDAAKTIRVLMENDTSAEVRRACMKLIEKNAHTRESIFERARDVTAANRRMLFSTVLPKFGDFRTIGAEDRSRLLASGLRDRDASVREAATRWLTDCWLPTLQNDLLEFVERLRPVESDIAETALRTLIDKKPELVQDVKFDSEILSNLTSEYALLFKVVYEYASDKNNDRLLESYPEAAEFADILQLYFRLRVENLVKIDENREVLEADDSQAESLGIIDPAEYDYIILQLLNVAAEYDYHDEFGRSKMLNVLRSILATEGLQEKLINVLILCIRKLSINERDFSQMIVEIINDLRDASDTSMGAVDSTIEGENVSGGDAADRSREDSDDSDDSDDEFVDAASRLSIASVANKSRMKELEKETKQVASLPESTVQECLTIAKRMLELVHEPLEDNMYLESILHNLIRPSLQRTEVDIRTLALTCVGLCCVLDKELAVRNMFLCGVFITKSDNDQLIIAGLKVIADLLAVHGTSILGQEVEGSIDAMAVAKLFYRTLRDSSRKEVQAVSGEALYKLFLSGIINDDELFETTLLAYFNPEINDNQALKQCLSFCIPVFAFSHTSHQELIARIIADTLGRLFQGWSDMLKNVQPGTTILTPKSIVEQLLYWTDPYRVANVDEEEAEQSSIHVEVGIQLLRLLCELDSSVARKPFVRGILSMLTHLTFTEKADIFKLKELCDLADSDAILSGELEEVMKNTTLRNSYGKFRLYAFECYEKAKKLSPEAAKKAEEESAKKAEEEEADRKAKEEAAKQTAEDADNEEGEVVEVSDDEEFEEEEDDNNNEEGDPELLEKGGDVTEPIEITEGSSGPSGRSSPEPVAQSSFVSDSASFSKRRASISPQKPHKKARMDSGVRVKAEPMDVKQEVKEEIKEELLDEPPEESEQESEQESEKAEVSEEGPQAEDNDSEESKELEKGTKKLTLDDSDEEEENSSSSDEIEEVEEISDDDEEVSEFVDLDDGDDDDYDDE